MDGHDVVNDEIRSFLSIAEKQPREPPRYEAGKDADATKDGNVASLLELLKNIQGLYSEINVILASGDKQSARNTLLNSDIGMSPVCESLMNVLRDAFLEKEELVLSEERSKERLKKLREERDDLEMRMNRMESDLGGIRS